MKAYSAQKYRRFDYFRAKIKVSSMRKYSSDPLFRSRLKPFLKERYHSHRGTKEKKKLLVKANRCSVLKSIQTFQKNIEDKPIHVCTVCIRTFFRNQVKKCNRQKYFDKEVISENAKKCITGKFLKTTDDRQLNVKFLKDPQFTEWICSTCDRHLKANNMPLQAYVNNLELLTISEQLQHLNDLEKQLVALRIPFSKIVALPKDGQKGVKGPVIGVPSDLNVVTNILPRPLNDAQLVNVKLKRKLSYKVHHQYEWINPHSIMEDILM